MRPGERKQRRASDPTAPVGCCRTPQTRSFQKLPTPKQASNLWTHVASWCHRRLRVSHQAISLQPPLSISTKRSPSASCNLWSLFCTSMSLRPSMSINCTSRPLPGHAWHRRHQGLIRWTADGLGSFHQGRRCPRVEPLDATLIRYPKTPRLRHLFSASNHKAFNQRSQVTFDSRQRFFTQLSAQGNVRELGAEPFIASPSPPSSKQGRRNAAG